MILISNIFIKCYGDYHNLFSFPTRRSSDLYSFNQFFVGADLGYAIYVGSGDSDGGFLYEPKFGYDAVSFDIYAFYKGISSKQKYEGFSQTTTLGSVGVGFAYKF